MAVVAEDFDILGIPYPCYIVVRADPRRLIVFPPVLVVQGKKLKGGLTATPTTMAVMIQHFHTLAVLSLLACHISFASICIVASAIVLKSSLVTNWIRKTLAIYLTSQICTRLAKGLTLAWGHLTASYTDTRFLTTLGSCSNYSLSNLCLFKARGACFLTELRWTLSTSLTKPLFPPSVAG
jgi:hypothetical protein